MDSIQASGVYWRSIHLGIPQCRKPSKGTTLSSILGPSVEEDDRQETQNTVARYSLYPSICPSIYPYIHLSIYPSIHLSIYQSINLSIYLTSPSTSPFLSPSLPFLLPSLLHLLILPSFLPPSDEKAMGYRSWEKTE